MLSASLTGTTKQNSMLELQKKKIRASEYINMENHKAKKTDKKRGK